MTATKEAEIRGSAMQEPTIPRVSTQGFKSKAMLHSLGCTDEVVILHERGANDVVAEYKGVRYTAIFNPFVGLYYVDDVYGELPKQHYCPYCGTFIP